MKCLIISAAFGLFASAAMADCMGSGPITANADGDQTIVTASIAQDMTAASDDRVIISSDSKQPEPAPVEAVTQ